MKQLKRANIIMSKKLLCNDARSYQRSVNRVADGSRLVPKQFDDEIPWSPASMIGSSCRLLLISQSQHEVKIGLQSEFKSSRFRDQVHRAVFFPKNMLPAEHRHYSYHPITQPRLTPIYLPLNYGF